MFKNLKYEYVEVEEINKRLRYCQRYRKIIYRKRNDNESVGLNAYIENKMVEFRLTYRDATGKVATYITFKDCRQGVQKTTGMEAFRVLSLYYKVPKREAPFSASPFLYKNDKYEGQRVEAIGYDLNAAYSYAMVQPMPDTSVPPKSKKVSDNEIGFSPSGNIRHKGEWAPYVFPLIESPFKKFVEHWFEMKKVNKEKAKGILNYSVGYLQKVNPFLRATIVNRCNEYIKSLMDENTIYCNTDCIVSLKPRDFKLGDGLGEWKIEHKGKFAFKGFNYQWNLDIPSYRSKPKTWFPKNWDILKDEVPVEGNMVEFNIKNIKLEKNNVRI